MGSEMIRGHLDALVLAAVDHGADYGYAIAEQLRLRSDGVFDLAEGTLYPALYRLETDGFLDSRWTSVDGRRRRIYSLTRRGTRALRERKRQWVTFSAAVAEVLGLPAATRTS